MREYRKRFVQLNMLLIGLVLLLMVAAVAVYMYRDYYDGLEMAMRQVVEPLNSFLQPPQAPKPPASGQGGPKGEPRREGRERRREIMAVFYAPEKEEAVILSQTSLLDEEDLEAVLEAVVSQKDGFGTLYGWHTIYYRAGNESPYRIALTSTSYIGRSMLSLALVLLLVWLGAMACFLLVSVRLSKRAVRPLEKAMERERQFVADASHDLKTPLSVILANNSILRENPQATAGSLEKWIDSTQNAAKNMQCLIGEMLTLAGVERRDAPLPLEAVDCSAIVMKAALQLESVAYEKNVELETEIPERVMLRANEDYLQRIAASLLENAIKYEPDGGRVWVRLEKARHNLRLEVGNRGTVIPPEDLPHIFERFYRGDKSRQGQAGGHGLGLSITKEMVERLGGGISVESRSESGTVFKVVLPCRGL